MRYEDIKTLRIQHGISQTKLAEYSGYTKSKISGWELEKETPSDAELEKLKQTLDYLIPRIQSGELNLKGHRIIHTAKAVGDRQPLIKDGEDYKKRTAKMSYSSEYVQLLSSLYKKAMTSSPRNIKGIGLFSGCGGLDLGFEAAGIDIIGHVEIWDAANKIYAENFPNSRLLKEDINDVTEDDISSWKKEFGEVEIIVGGPPCQGFSLAGKRDPEDMRNQLYQQYVRIVSNIRPKVFVFENVAKLTSMKTKEGGLFLDAIIDAFSDAGYTIKYKTVNAYEYGVPQSRERVLLVGVRDDVGKTFAFPEPEYVLTDTTTNQLSFFQKKSARTFKIATQDLEILENGQSSSNDPLHWAIVHPDHVVEWLRDVPEGQSAHDNPDPAKRPPSGFNTTYKRNVWNEPCSTISTNFNMISGCRNVHPTSTRSLTIREATRAQSFPDEFVFCGKWGDIRSAIGNAVPPLLAYVIAKEILRQIFEEADYGTETRK
jgi:DNA (cytosine-5)-methyltransferase 1